MLHHSLLDPSCSGSGIVNRLDHLLDTGNNLTTSRSLGTRTQLLSAEENELNQERLNKLAGFQLKMVKHAMKCMLHALFPNRMK
jgi:putative methyltransferase